MRYLLVFFVYFYATSALAAKNIPILDIDAKNQSGYEIGISVAKNLLKHFPDLSKRYDNYLVSQLDPYLFQILQSTTDAFRQQLDPSLRDEIDGLATLLVNTPVDQLGDNRLSYNELWILQRMFDTDRATQGAAFGVTGKAAVNDSPVVTSRIDINGDKILKDLQAIIIYHYPEKSVVNIGIAGFLGTLNGFNSNGLFAAYVNSPLESWLAPVENKAKQSAAFALRKALKNHATVPQAAKQLSQNTYYSSHNILLADPQTVQVLEQPATGKVTLRHSTSPLQNSMLSNNPYQIAAVNCFAAQGSPANCTESLDQARWYDFNQQTQFSPEKKATPFELTQLMRHPSALALANNTTNTTTQAMVFEPKNRRLYLYNPETQALETTALQETVRLEPAKIFSVTGLFGSLSENTTRLIILGIFIIMITVVYWILRLRW